MSVTLHAKKGDPPAALTAVKRQLEATEGGGPVVKESIRRHYEHLESLAGGLRRLGMDEHEIDENITFVFREYERELDRYLRTVADAGGRGPQDG